MVFKKLKASLGLGGGANVETHLQTDDVRPGDTVTGEIVVTAGDLPQSVKYVEIALQTRVEVETDDGEYDSNQVFHRQRVTEAFELAPGDEQRFGFQLAIPFETPVNVFGGTQLPKVQVGVRTELEIARAVDSTDLDPLRVHPLPVQEAALQAIERLGFHFKGSDVEKGRVPGASLPFYQEIEFHGSSRFPGVNELELTFISTQGGTTAILEVDRRGGFLSSGGDSVGRVNLGAAPSPDIDASIEAAIQQLGRSRGLFG